MVVQDSTSLRPVAADSSGVNQFTKWLMRIAVIVALGWTIYSYRHLRIYSWPAMRHDIWSAFVTLFHRLPGLAVLYVIFEISFCVGAIMMVWGLGEKIFDGGKVAWVRKVRKRVKELFHSDSTNKWYRRGLYLNWIGAAMTTGVIPIIAIIWLFPSNRWLGLMAVPIADLISTFVWRIAARPKPTTKVSHP